MAGNDNTYKDNIRITELRLHCASVGVKQVGIQKPEKGINDVLINPFIPETSKKSDNKATSTRWLVAL